VIGVVLAGLGAIAALVEGRPGAGRRSPSRRGTPGPIDRAA